jgi:hypothetical protein
MTGAPPAQGTSLLFHYCSYTNDWRNACARWQWQWQCPRLHTPRTCARAVSNMVGLVDKVKVEHEREHGGGCGCGGGCGGGGAIVLDEAPLYGEREDDGRADEGRRRSPRRRGTDFNFNIKGGAAQGAAQGAAAGCLLQQRGQTQTGLQRGRGKKDIDDPLTMFAFRAALPLPVAAALPAEAEGGGGSSILPE